jgi:hypothetical protein
MELGAPDNRRCPEQRQLAYPQDNMGAIQEQFCSTLRTVLSNQAKSSASRGDAVARQEGRPRSTEVHSFVIRRAHLM